MITALLVGLGFAIVVGGYFAFVFRNAPVINEDDRDLLEEAGERKGRI